MFAFHLGHGDVQDTPQSSLLNRFAECEVRSQIKSFFGACQTIYNRHDHGLLVRMRGSQFGDCPCASGHIITVDHKPIQMTAGGELDRTHSILTELKGGPERTQTCLQMT
jgi:hypothetical protein